MCMMTEILQVQVVMPMHAYLIHYTCLGGHPNLSLAIQLNVFIYKDIIWIYAHICEQLLAEIFDINPEPNLIELFP